MHDPKTWFATCALTAVATFAVGRSMFHAPAEPPGMSPRPQRQSTLPTGAPHAEPPPAGIPAWADAVGADLDPASGLPRVVRDRGTGIELVLVPAGRFERGDAHGRGNRDELPVHEVVLAAPFYLGRFEVTQQEWAQAATGDPTLPATPSRTPGSTRLPVEQVSWKQVQRFLELTGLRLPTEAEWEYAARAGDDGDGPLNARGWFHDNANEPKPVDLMTDGANAWGLVGMFGNVREWCADRYDDKYYAECKQRAPVADPHGPADGNHRVVRGNSFRDARQHSRFGDRGHHFENDGDIAIGFRVARNP